MGHAAYQRGSKVLSDRLDREQNLPPRPVREDRTPVESKPDPALWQIGDKAWCHVHGAEGWTTVTAVKGTVRDQRIKIRGLGQWCPAYNFSREAR